MTIQSRNKLSKSNAHTIGTRRFEGTGDLSSYVRSVVQHPSNTNANTPNTFDRRTVDRVTRQANAFLSQSGSVPSVSQIGAWL